MASELPTAHSINTECSLLFMCRCLFEQVTGYREKTPLTFTDNCVPVLLLLAQRTCAGANSKTPGSCESWLTAASDEIGNKFRRQRKDRFILHTHIYILFTTVVEAKTWCVTLNKAWLIGAPWRLFYQCASCYTWEDLYIVLAVVCISMQCWSADGCS